MTTYERHVVLSTTKFDVLGTRPVRPDATDKVTGRAKFGADHDMTGLLYGKILRSPHAHGRIKSMDTSRAEALPGVQAIVTAKDLPETVNKPGERQMTPGALGADLKYLRDRIMAGDKVIFKGHPVAAVAATSVHIAEEAIQLIDVDYEVLPASSTVHEAMREGASIILEDLEFKEFGENTGKTGNVAEHTRDKKGDIDKGFEEADVVVEREFNTSTVHQGYIEPHNCTVQWNADGRILVWNSTQGPFNVRDDTAATLGLPSTRVRLTPMEIGGAFGGKFEPYAEPVAALLSKRSGHPVKIVMTRSEEFESTGPTPGAYLKVKIGATKEGKITAAQGDLRFEAGAYPGSVVGAAVECLFAPYDIPNMTVDGYDVVVNKTKTAAYRAPGSTNAAFATESVMDEVAAKIGMDPLELRLLNTAKEGTRKLDGTSYPRIGCVEVIEAMRAHPHYSAPLEGPNRGRGVAVGYWMNAGLQSSANIAVESDGTVALTEGSPDLAGSRNALAMQAAEALGIRIEDVHPSVVDTDSIGYTFGSGGSRVTFATGWAVYEAAQDVKRQMVARAALIWGVDSEDVEMEKGVIRSKTDTELKMTFKELAAELNDTGGPITGRGNVDPKGAGVAFAGNIVDLEVDPETGKIEILRFTIVQDAGKAIHPSYVEGQLQGGVVQGIGWGLNEEYYIDDSGGMLNTSFLDYRLPTALDIPMIDTVIVEVANPGHPFGVRGVGEVSIAPPPAALANAINAAIGVRMAALPMNPGAVMDAVWKKAT